MQTQIQLLLLQKTMVVVEGVARKLYPETNIWEVSRPVLEDWLKNLKSPKSTIDTALNTSAEIIKRIPDFPALNLKFQLVIFEYYEQTILLHYFDYF